MKWRGTRDRALAGQEPPPWTLEEPVSDERTEAHTATVQRTRDGVLHVKVPGPSTTHLDRWVKRRCAADLLALGLYPNTKEISESEGMAWWAMHAFGWSAGDETVGAVVVADGTTPRTGALIAFTTTWCVASVDPNLHQKWETRTVQRLDVVRHRIEQAPGAPGLAAARKVVVVAPHSHARLPDAVAYARRCAPEAERITAVALACCRDQSLPGRTCDRRVRDLAIWSPHNVVQIWHDAEGATTEQDLDETMRLAP